MATNQSNAVKIPFIKKKFVIGWYKNVMDSSLGACHGWFACPRMVYLSLSQKQVKHDELSHKGPNGNGGWMTYKIG